MLPAMHARILRVFFALAAAPLLFAGCQAPPRPNGPTTAVWRISDFDAFLDDTLSVLRECDLQPARVERAGGLVVTQPTTSAQWFEWWRRDTRGGYQLLESSLHTIRRTVTLRTEPAGSPATDSAPQSETPPGADHGLRDSTAVYRITIQVEKERLSAPLRQITTASGALSIYNERVPTETGERGPRTIDQQWVPLGRDVLLEEYLLARLAGLRQVSRPDIPPGEPDGAGS